MSEDLKSGQQDFRLKGNACLSSDGDFFGKKKKS